MDGQPITYLEKTMDGSNRTEPKTNALRIIKKVITDKGPSTYLSTNGEFLNRLIKLKHTLVRS